MRDSTLVHPMGPQTAMSYQVDLILMRVMEMKDDLATQSRSISRLCQDHP